MEMIIFKDGRKYYFVKRNEIKWIESCNGILKIHVNDKYFISKMTLQNLKEKLSSDNFIQISRSKIINLQNIKELINIGTSNDFDVILDDSTVLKWGRRYKKNFPELLLIK